MVGVIVGVVVVVVVAVVGGVVVVGVVLLGMDSLLCVACVSVEVHT